MNGYCVGMMILAVVNEGNAQQPERTERMFVFHSDDQTENLVRCGLPDKTHTTGLLI
jgi:hypothetical protein